MARRSFETVFSLLYVLVLSITTRTVYALPSGATEISLVPVGWSEVGCFSDLSTARTLQGAAASSENMTVEECITVCGDFVFAGVEFGQECYCDSTIQLPGAPVDSSECDTPCIGNTSETCGGTNTIQIFTNGKSSPTLLPEIDTDEGGFLSVWEYKGCFVDDPNSRVLPTPVGALQGQGIDPVTCVEVCLEAGFSLAGTEAGRECWCGGHANVLGVGDELGLNPNGTQAPDTDCRAVCASNHDLYCGNSNRIAVYSMTEHETPPTQPSQNCSITFGNITLIAETSAGEQIPLKAVIAEMVPSVTWTVLSGCPNCCDDYQFFGLADFLTPRSNSNPNQFMFSVDTTAGESPTFMAPTTLVGSPQTDKSYCAGSRPMSPPENVLTYQNKTDGFALCRNNSALANGRMDVVFQPLANHPNYALEECQDVVVRIQ